LTLQKELPVLIRKVLSEPQSLSEHSNEKKNSLTQPGIEPMVVPPVVTVLAANLHPVTNKGRNSIEMTQV
jgi:hypothetical protein